MEITAIMALVVVLFPMVIGDLVSIKTKAFVPSVFVTAIIFLVGFLTFLPRDIIQIATLSQPVAGMCVYLLITHMGSMMNVRELLNQWKAVVISLAGIVGIIAILMTVGVAVLGREVAVVGAPPLTGGIVAAIIMKDAAIKAGLPNLGLLAVLVYVVQGFIGYPLTAILLKKEAGRLLNNYRNGIYENKMSEGEDHSEMKTLLPPLPEEYNTTYMVLFKLAFVAFLADIFTKFLNTNVFHNPTALSPMITCLIFGVIFAQIGFLDRQPLSKANAFGWMITVLMAFIFEGLNNATVDMLGKVAVDLIGVVIIGVIGLLLFAFIVGRLLKVSKYMALPIALNALYGFPPNYILTTEAIKSKTYDQEEREYLTSMMMPQMLIGGFTTVTIASVVIGGIFAGIL